MKRLTTFAAAIALVASSPCVALSQGAFSSSHIGAAINLLTVMETEKEIRTGLAVMLDDQTERNPDFAEIRPVFEEFFDKHLTWDVLQLELAKVWAGSFSEQELGQLAQFFQTPLGKKLVEKQSTIFRETMRIAENVIDENSAELEQMIEARLAEIGELETPAQPPAPSP